MKTLILLLSFFAIATGRIAFADFELENCIAQQESTSGNYTSIFAGCQTCVSQYGGGTSIGDCQNVAQGWCRSHDPGGPNGYCRDNSGCSGLPECGGIPTPGGQTQNSLPQPGGNLHQGCVNSADGSCSSPGVTVSPKANPLSTTHKDTPSTAANKSGPTTSPGSEPAASTCPSQTDADSDVASCQSAYDSANSYCSNPGTPPTTAPVTPTPTPTSTPGASNQSMIDQCNQMRNSSTNNANFYSNAASTCATKASNFQSSCQALVSKYSNQPSTCSSNSSTYSQTVTKLNNILAGYQALQSQISNLGTLQSSGGVNAAQSAACEQAASGGGMPQMPTPDQSQNNQDDKTGCTADPTSAACQDCSKNPNTPTCKQLAQANAATANTGKAQFLPAPSQPQASNFDTGSPGDGLTGQNQYGNYKPTGSQVTPVPGDNGGGMGAGGAGSGSRQAQLDQRRQGGSPGASYTTQIEQGLRSGGGGGGSTQVASGEGFKGYGDGGRGPASEGEAKMDLKKYLPGEALDPHRHIAGAEQAGLGSKYGPSVWEMISTSFHEECSFGHLRHCK